MITHIPEDMTVTVTGEVTLAALQVELGKQGQWLPVDPPPGMRGFSTPHHIPMTPHPALSPSEGAREKTTPPNFDARENFHTESRISRGGIAVSSGVEALTIAELIDSNASGPRRFGYGTIRDYLIGIAVTLADGTVIHSGGKVVKNVAGYDLLKLFVGGRGSLGTVLDATFKLRPLPECENFVQSRVESFAAADKLVGTVVKSEVTPVVLDWHNLEHRWLTVVLGFAGTREDVEWQVSAIRELGFTEPASLDYDAIFWSDPAPVNRLSVLPSRVFGAIQGLGETPFVARAGNGLIYHRGKPAWSGDPLPVARMRRLKDAFDPKHILPELPL